MTTPIEKLPAFGDLLNAGIQTLKQLNSRNTISQNLFFREFDRIAGIAPEHKTITYLSSYDIRNEYTAGTPCYDLLTDLVVLCLTSLGVVKENKFSLVPNVGKDFANLLNFDETVTPKNLYKIDPLGRIYFWLIQDNFANYQKMSIANNAFIADLAMFDSKSYRELKKVNEVAYTKKGDPLINQFIEEATRRTSLIMNKYRDVLVADSNSHVRVTPAMIATQLDSLTPLQFEWFCLKLVERSLENENPETNLIAQHTGKTNDGGIDGMIRQEFPNGEIHTYYIQAKLYSQGNNISNRELRGFVGAYPPDKNNLHGIFITSSAFTRPAYEYHEMLDSHSLILIDQLALIELMIEHEVGVKQVDSNPKLVMDNDFFEKMKRL